MQGLANWLTSHFSLPDIRSQDNRQSLCTYLIVPLHLQGWNKGLSGSPSHLQILQTTSSSSMLTLKGIRLRLHAALLLLFYFCHQGTIIGTIEASRCLTGNYGSQVLGVRIEVLRAMRTKSIARPQTLMRISDSCRK